MTIIYDAMIIQHGTNPNPNIIIFYDEDKMEVLKYIQKYVERNGFTYVKDGNQFTCATIALRERAGTGGVISVTPYHELFDTVTGKILKGATE